MCRIAESVFLRVVPYFDDPVARVKIQTTIYFIKVKLFIINSSFFLLSHRAGKAKRIKKRSAQPTGSTGLFKVQNIQLSK